MNIKINSGRIIENLVLFTQKCLRKEIEKNKPYDFPILEAFPCDEKSSSRLETGKNWIKDCPDSGEMKVLNKDFCSKSKVFLVSSEERTNVIVWKVVFLFEEKYYLFDLRSDALFDIMMNGEIKDGQILAPLIWVVVGSETKIVLLGGSIYKQIQEIENSKRAEKIKELEIGGIYEDWKEQNFVYYGEKYCLNIIDKGDGERILRRYHPNGIDFSIISKPKVKIVKKQLWYGIFNLAYFEKNEFNLHYCNLVLKKDVIKKVGNTSKQLPDKYERKESFHYFSDFLNTLEKAYFSNPEDAKKQFPQLEFI